MKPSTLAIFALATLLAIAFLIYAGEHGDLWASDTTKNGKAVAVLSKPPGETLGITVGTKGEITYDLSK